MLITGKAEFRRVNEPYSFKGEDDKDHVYNSMEIEDDNGRITLSIPDKYLEKAKALERGKFYNFNMEMREYRGKKKVSFVGVV